MIINFNNSIACGKLFATTEHHSSELHSFVEHSLMVSNVIQTSSTWDNIFLLHKGGRLTRIGIGPEKSIHLGLAIETFELNLPINHSNFITLGRGTGDSFEISLDNKFYEASSQFSQNPLQTKYPIERIRTCSEKKMILCVKKSNGHMSHKLFQCKGFLDVIVFH